MQLIADGALYFWPLVVVALFAWLPPRRAVLTALMVGWLFLPVHEISLPMIPDYSKMSATCFGVFAAILLFDATRLFQFRFRWFDLPLLLYCLSPLPASLTNGLGLYDGVAGVIGQTIAYGMPYLIGRLYFRTAEDLYQLAWAIVIGGIIYVPFCLFENRMSPQLHTMLYGFRPGSYNVSRFGGWRPTVFMRDGLQLAMWMATASLVAGWLWWNRRLPSLASLKPGLLLAALVATTLLTRSTGAILLLAMGTAALAVTKLTTSRPALVGLLLIVPVFISVRASSTYGWQFAVDAARMISQERAQSLQFRFKNEDLLLAKALQRPLFGWGGWGRNRVYNDDGRDITITDGRWIIELGQRGLFGTVAYFTLLLFPLALLLYKYSAQQLMSQQLAPVVALTVAITLFAIDCLPNDMPNPLYIVMAGAVLGVTKSDSSYTSSHHSETRVRGSRGAHVLERRL